MNKILLSQIFRKDHYIQMSVNKDDKYVVTIYYKGTNKIKENRSPESRIYDNYNNAKNRFDLLHIIEKNNFNLENKSIMENLVNDFNDKF